MGSAATRLLMHAVPIPFLVYGCLGRYPADSLPFLNRPPSTTLRRLLAHNPASVNERAPFAHETRRACDWQMCGNARPLHFGVETDLQVK